MSSNPKLETDYLLDIFNEIKDSDSFLTVTVKNGQFSIRMHGDTLDIAVALSRGKQEELIHMLREYKKLQMW